MNRDKGENLTPEELADLLKKARKAKEKETGKKITHKMVAEAIGVDRTTVTMWEQGKRYPGFLNIVNYCNFLGMTIDGLLGVKTQHTLHLELTEEERESILGMIEECKQESDSNSLHHKLHALDQYLRAFLSRAYIK